jgi:hypothetical protein
MGSFANNLHVKCEDAAKAAAIVRNALSAEGYQLTDEELDEEARWGFSATLRAIHLSAARDGWVSLLDTDLMNSIGLAATLSGQLETHALQVMVNDSDSWHYHLYYAGQPVDKFNSSGSEECEEDGGISDREGVFGGGQLADLQRSIRESAHELEQRLRQLLPADLRDIQDRWKAGRATPEEIQKYTQWISTEMPRLMGGFKDLLGGLVASIPPLGGLISNFPLPARQPTPENELQSHVAHLRPLLQSGVSDDRVREVLGKKDVFAEHTLEEFLPLIGIAPKYAYLSYRYLDEYSAADLAAKSIRLEHHLKFKKQ